MSKGQRMLKEEKGTSANRRKATPTEILDEPVNQLIGETTDCSHHRTTKKDVSGFDQAWGENQEWADRMIPAWPEAYWIEESWDG